ncbi:MULTISPECIES: hypothetical protein [unclassified Prochlorococcus]|uniref:hypothetical protein n=1 Tax=Prochlorococcus sp. MIT 0718 TaxID=3082539 RepID=UPI001F4C6B5F
MSGTFNANSDCLGDLCKSRRVLGNYWWCLKNYCCGCCCDAKSAQEQWLPQWQQ